MSQIDSKDRKKKHKRKRKVSKFKILGTLYHENESRKLLSKCTSRACCPCCMGVAYKGDFPIHIKGCEFANMTQVNEVLDESKILIGQCVSCGAMAVADEKMNNYMFAHYPLCCFLQQMPYNPQECGTLIGKFGNRWPKAIKLEDALTFVNITNLPKDLCNIINDYIMPEFKKTTIHSSRNTCYFCKHVVNPNEQLDIGLIINIPYFYYDLENMLIAHLGCVKLMDVVYLTSERTKKNNGSPALDDIKFVTDTIQKYLELTS